jgi:Helix-turn-helix domain
MDQDEGHPSYPSQSLYPAKGMTLDDSILAMRRPVMRRAQELRSVTRACQAAGISRTVFYRWRARFERYGPVGLHPRRHHARRGRPRQLTLPIGAADPGRGAGVANVGRAGALPPTWPASSRRTWPPRRCNGSCAALACRVAGIAWRCVSTTVPGLVGSLPSGRGGSSPGRAGPGADTCTPRSPANWSASISSTMQRPHQGYRLRGRTPAEMFAGLAGRAS